MSGKRATARIIVDGMTCSSCEQRIEKAVRALDGVSHVTASASLSEVMVYYDADLVNREAIHAAITGAGYQVRNDPHGTAPAAIRCRTPGRRGGKVAVDVPLPLPRPDCRGGRDLPDHPLHRRLHLPSERDAVHGVRPHLRGRPADLPALHRDVRRDRAVPGDQAPGGGWRSCQADGGTCSARTGLGRFVGAPAAEPPLQRRPRRFLHDHRGSRGRPGLPVQPFHGAQGDHAGDRGSVHALPRRAHARCLPLALAAESPVPRHRRQQDARRRVGTRAFRRRALQRPDAVRAAADDAGLCPGDRKLSRRRALDVPLQPRAPFRFSLGLERSVHSSARSSTAGCSRPAASW